jgi:hypothetical protein
VVDRNAAPSGRAIHERIRVTRRCASQPTYGGSDRSQADRQRGDDAISRANPYIRRAPDPSAGPGIDRSVRPDYRPYAVPRSTPTYGAPTMSPDADRPVMPDYRSNGIERRGADRPAAPPAGMAAPPPGVYRANPGVERGPGSAPDNHGGGGSPAAGQGHSRGGNHRPAPLLRAGADESLSLITDRES